MCRSFAALRTTTLLALLSPVAVQAQQRTRSDTARLAEVVVTAERAPSAVASAVSAVTRVSGAELARMPHVTLADVLRMAPGFSLVDFDGLGYDPQLMARGFYGGGEAEYVVVLVDGRPMNQVHTGVVAWDALPPVASIDAVEIVRGGGSSLYGDAAVAGVMNVITRRSHVARTGELRFDAAGGSSGSLRAGADLDLSSVLQGAGISGALDRTDGYRKHAQRTTGRARATAGLFESATSRLTATLASNWRAFDEPGALIASLLAADRRASDDLFRFDHTKDQTHALTLDGMRQSGAARLTASGTAEHRAFDAIRTIALAPGFGDTKERDATTNRGAAGVQAEIDDSPIPGHDRLIVGAEGSHGTLDSRYYKIFTATRNRYLTASGTRGALDTEGSSRRNAAALYADYSVHPVPALRLSLGGRYDRINDAFDPAVPTGGTRATTNHSAFSPKGGVNVQYWNGPGGTGNAFVAVSRSFKAPTLDQLYDQRRIPFNAPPYQITISNAALQPQHGASVEGGVYQGAELWPGARLAASVSGYQIDMTDELDFDFKTLRYINIGRSRHRGVEVGANVEGAHSSAFAAYTLQSATSRSGGSDGKRLQAIPRHTVNGGVSLSPLAWLEGSLSATHVRDVYLDDANTVTLPNYTRADLRVGLRARGQSVFAEVRNLFDARYSTTGFLDPSGTGQAYFYPAAGRIIEVGVRSGF